MIQKISIVLPAYNEAKNIFATVASIADYFDAKQVSYEIIVVDDGSNDTTASIVEKIARKNSRVALVQHQKNRGKGAAVKTGVLAANGDIIVFLDSDGSTPVQELKKFFPYIENGYDVVIGSRYIKASAIIIKQPWARIAIGRLGNFIIQLLLLPGIVDTQCGCKMFTRKSARHIFSRQRVEGWGFDMEALAIAKKQGLRIKEVPVSWYDAANRASRFRPLKDVANTLGELLFIKTNLVLGRYR